MAALCTLLSLLFFLQCIVGQSGNPKTLIVVENDFAKYSYSRFFKSLKRRGHNLSIKPVTDKSIKLTEYGESLYSNLIILSPSSKTIGELTYKDLLTFIDNGNNLFIGVDATYSDLFKKIADRTGIELNKNSVYDHLSYDLLREDSALKNDVILLSNWPKYKAVIGDESELPSAPILYEGIGMKLKKNAHLSLSLLSGNIGTYSSNQQKNGPVDKTIFTSGNRLSLVAALQMRNNARITIVGSLKMLSDAFFISPVQSSSDGKSFDKAGNEQFVSLISAWSFGERGILRISNAVHHQQRPDHIVNPTRYRIKDLVSFGAKIEEYRLECDCFVPFKEDDVQFEFIRLDPFVRQLMSHDGKGNYKIDFMLPDVFGVYKFTVNYQRRGWGYIAYEQLVSVRPFRHDEYERFLSVAYPYYLGTASMVIGFAVFTFVFLFGVRKENGKQLKIW